MKMENPLTEGQLPVSLTARQQEVWEQDARRQARLTILHGAVRSGKTTVNNLLWLRHLRSFEDKRLKFIMTGATLGALQRNVLDELALLTGEAIRLNSRNQFELGQQTVVCFGAQDSGAFRAIKGFTAHGWYANEVTEHDQEAVRQCFARCSGKGARIFWDTNPDSPHHFVKTGFIDRAGEDGHIAVHHFRLEDNTYLDPEYVESLKRSIPENSVWYRRNIEGLWTAASNLIYSHYRIAPVEVRDWINGMDEWLGGLDFGRGGQSPFAFLLIGRRGNDFLVCEEVYRSGCLNHEFLELTKERLRARHSQLIPQITVYADSADPDKMEEWRRAGFRIVGADKSPYSVRAGIERVMSVGLTIDPYCGHTVKEIQSYQWEGRGRAVPGEIQRPLHGRVTLRRLHPYQTYGLEGSGDAGLSRRVFHSPFSTLLNISLNYSFQPFL